MAAIDRLASGKWRAQVRREGIRHSKTFPTRRDAERWAARLEGAIASGDYVDLAEARRTTLYEALERYLAEVAEHKRGWVQERNRVRQWQRDPLAQRSLASVRSTEIAAWRDERVKAGRAPSTIRNALSVISQVYKLAASEWMMPLANPVAAVRMPRLRPPRDRRLEPGELEAILAALSCPWTRAAALLAVETGCRRGELLGLLWPDVRGNVAQLRRTKNGRPRTVPLSSRALAVLERLPRSLHGRVLPIEATVLDHRWRRACAAAGVEGVTFHTLRHEATSRLFERGLDVVEVMSITGHSSLAMVQRYAHLRARNLVAKLG
jgi:integrase